LQDEMERSFLDYAMSVIMSRALPDVRDGLKPVHRRIIWDMEQQGFRPNRPFVKSARVTGDTMAKYHPHGNSAIYDALVRMAQPFSLRHPLIDFHGNYGSPDFGAAAERYTECRLHPLAMQMLADIDENTVDMLPNYDNTTEEPSVLPARFPNLLVNGSQGIAVGMATSIPPHNLGEVIDATGAPDRPPRRHPRRPDAVREGPRLPDRRHHPRARRHHGRVPHRVAAASRCAPRPPSRRGKRGQMQIVVTELPYQTSCNSIASRIQELVDAGELDGIADVNDASAGGKTNLVVTLKRDANANVVLNNLFKLTSLQTSFPVNMVALVDGVPRTLNLVQALRGLHPPPGGGHHPPHRVPPRQGEARPHPRGRIKALNVIDADHRPHPGERGRRVGQGVA
jgi:DNA gyrase subunit A